MSNLSIGLIIGAALSSGFGSVIGSAASKISQLEQKGQRLKIGETIGVNCIPKSESRKINLGLSSAINLFSP